MAIAITHSTAISISSVLRQSSSTLQFPFPTTNVSNSRIFSVSPMICSHEMSLLSVPRRLLLPSVSSIWDALTGGNNSAREAVIAIQRGMQLFRQGDVMGSLVEFDKAIELDPRQKAYLWQRGLSLYYLNRFDEGAEQFRLDVGQNPNDTEEAIWCFLCEAPLYGVEEARKRFLEVGRDPRRVMRNVYTMFKDGGDPDKLVAAFSSSREDEYFYATLYAGLSYESENKGDLAKDYIVAACQSPYAQRSDDYMASLAELSQKYVQRWRNHT
ncbi:hypothetical protein Nepgr_001592 [Nepenthes gracilis]|uniref:Uncharacterized protein n=1 Tax=Nepenthes gracilis TaxID=150966 RepID=A0AAD3P7F2_NEPGR|nr:hypothetical protein Nepgr_001592 [Nepenthes gracilis]